MHRGDRIVRGPKKIDLAGGFVGTASKEEEIQLAVGVVEKLIEAAIQNQRAPGEMNS